MIENTFFELFHCLLTSNGEKLHAVTIFDFLHVDNFSSFSPETYRIFSSSEISLSPCLHVGLFSPIVLVLGKHF